MAAIMLFMLHCEWRLDQTGRLTNRHSLASLMGFEDRCINFLLILANITGLLYVNVRTSKFYKAPDHCESYTIAYMRRKRAEGQDMQNAEHGREEGRWENLMEYRLRTYQILEQIMRNGPLLLGMRPEVWEIEPPFMLSFPSGLTYRHRIARKLFKGCSWTGAMTVFPTIRLIVSITTVICSTAHNTKATWLPF